MPFNKQFEEKYDKLSKQNLRDYKVYLIEHYKPQTVNLRIRAINCYLESIKKEHWNLPSVKVQQKPFLENVISEADYLYFKNSGSVFQRWQIAANLYSSCIVERNFKMDG